MRAQSVDGRLRPGHGRAVLQRLRSGSGGVGGLWLLCAAALLLRLAVPAGWMPVADAHGVHFAVCPGSDDMAVGAHGLHASKHASDAPKQPSPKQPDGERPCSFAALGQSLASALEVVAPPPPARFRASPAAAPIPVRLTRDRADPRPPSTGPPASA